MKIVNDNWIVLQEADLKNDPTIKGIICLIPHTDDSNEFCTHLMRKDDKSLFWGHYFGPNLVLAAKDFEKRIEGS